MPSRPAYQTNLAPVARPGFFAIILEWEILMGGG